MSIQYEGDDILFVESDVAMDPSCCCNQADTTCCCLDQYVDPDPMAIPPGADFHVTFGGAISGTGTISMDPFGNTPPYCNQWTGFIIPYAGSNCGGEFSNIGVTLRCTTGATGEQSLELVLTPGGAGCSVDFKGGTWEPGSSCLPLYLVIKMWTKDIFPGGCPCGDDQLITMTITL